MTVGQTGSLVAFFVLCVERNEKEKMGLESGERWLRLKACTVLAEVWSSVPAVT